MVNYSYKPDEIDLNCQVYAESGELPVSSEVGKLAMKAQSRRGGLVVQKIRRRSQLED